MCENKELLVAKCISGTWLMQEYNFGWYFL